MSAIGTLASRLVQADRDSDAADMVRILGGLEALVIAATITREFIPGERYGDPVSQWSYRLVHWGVGFPRAVFGNFETTSWKRLLEWATLNGFGLGMATCGSGVYFTCKL